MKERKTYIVEALNKFVYEFCNFNWPNMPFGKRYGAVQLALLIDSFILIDKRIQAASINQDSKELFNFKLSSYYDNYLKENLVNLDKAFEKSPEVKDNISEKVQKFFRSKVADVK